MLVYNGFMLKEAILLEKLIQKGLTIAIAESCTGGLLSNRITNIPGSSKAFLLGTVTYSNDSKNKILKIPKEIIPKHGAVSEETAKCMALNIQKITQASTSLGITGIAGPQGGNKSKPVGTVFIALSYRGKTSIKKFHFSGNRLQVKRKAADKAMEMLLEALR